MLDSMISRKNWCQKPCTLLARRKMQEESNAQRPTPIALFFVMQVWESQACLQLEEETSDLLKDIGTRHHHIVTFRQGRIEFMLSILDGPSMKVIWSYSREAHQDNKESSASFGQFDHMMFRHLVVPSTCYVWPHVIRLAHAFGRCHISEGCIYCDG